MKPAKLPKGRVLFATTNCVTDLAVGAELHRWQSRLHCHPCAVLPCRTRQEARAWVNLSGNYWALVDVIATAMAQHRQGRTWPVGAEVLARSVLQALHLIP